MGFIVRNASANTITYTQPQTGAIARSIRSKLIESVSVKDFGAVGNNSTDDTAAIQAAIDAVKNTGVKLIFPAGTYKISDTIKVGYGNNQYVAIHIEGAGRNQDFGNCRIAPTFNDRPALNVQGARGVTITGISFIGKNTAPDSRSDFLSNPDYLDWITAGCTYGRYNPYCGVCIDAYSGPDPGAGNNYPNDSYNRYHTSRVTISQVEVRNFVVGYCVKPGNDDNNGEDIAFRDCVAKGCTFGLVTGGKQNKGISYTDGAMINCYCAYSGLRFGRQNGSIPRLFNLDIVVCHRLFEIANTVYSGSFTGLYCENFCEMGFFGPAYGSAANTLAVTGCTFNRTQTNSGCFAAFFMSVCFSGCSFQGSDPDGVMNFYVDGLAGAPSFVNCTFAHTGGTPDTKRIIYANSPLFMTGGCKFIYGVQSYCDNILYLTSLPARQPVWDSVWEIIVKNNPTTRYKITKGFTSTVHLGDARSLSADKLTVTITSTSSNINYYLVGDFIYWNIIVTNPAGAAFFLLGPAFKVTAIDTGTNTVTATSIILPEKVGSAPSNTIIYREPYVNATPSTATVTSGSNLLTNVTQIAVNFKYGDYIKGTGLPGTARVIGINTGTNTITMNVNANASGTNVTIDNSSLTAF